MTISDSNNFCNGSNIKLADRDRDEAQKAWILRQLSSQGKVATKTFRCSNMLRWRKQTEDSYRSEPECGKYDLVLQQAWECIETGVAEWRDVPIE